MALGGGDKIGRDANVRSRRLERPRQLSPTAELKGRSYITPQIAAGMEKSFIRDPRGRQQPKSLTPRQCEVVQLLAEGKSMKQIADLLNVTPRTVAFHKYRTMEELSLKSTAELIQFAIKNHIVVA